MSGRSSDILFSGGVMGTDSKSEAYLMAEKAYSLGVNPYDIILEEKSTNTLENVILSKPIIDQFIGLDNLRRIAVVSSEFHMMRCLLTLKKHLGDTVEYDFVPAKSSYLKQGNWKNTKKGRRIVIDEASKLIKYSKIGHIYDRDIEV
ncbi:hypothetical protein D3C76_1287010 [compost metagenome]